MPVIADPRDTDALIGDHLPLPDAEPEAEAPSALDWWSAAARGAPGGSLYNRFFGNPDPDQVEPVPADFDPFDHIEGYEHQARKFAAANSPAEVEGIKRRIASEEADTEVLRRAGWAGTGAQLVLTLADPTFLATMLIPGAEAAGVARLSRIARIGRAAAEGAAGAAAYEAAMQSLTETRSIDESLVNVAGGTLLSGVLGGILGRIPAGERKRLTDAIDTEINGNAGAASTRTTTTMEQESLARGGETIAKVQRGLHLDTDLVRVLDSDSTEARRIVQELADVTPYLEKNWEGIATSPSVESRVMRHEGAVADLVVELDRLYAQHRENPRPTLVGVPALSRREFGEAVTAAARRGDEGLFPDVTEGAKYLRARIFEPLKREAQRLGLLPENVSAVGAESYVTRLYDKAKIRAGRMTWDRILRDHFERQGMTGEDAGEIANQVTQSIMRTDAGVANFNAAFSVPNAGPLQSRTLAIEDELIEPFLTNDPVDVARRYVRELAPQVEVVRAFGDKDMTEVLDRVRAEYNILRARARSAEGVDGNALISKLDKNQERTIAALVRIRDRVLGTAGRMAPGASSSERLGVTIARGWRNLVSAARMGTTAPVSAIQDLHKIMSMNGFAPTMKRLTDMVSKPDFRRLSLAQHRRMGNAVEVAMSRRLAVATDGAVTDGWTQKLAEGVFKYTGLMHGTDFLRTVGGTLAEDRILQAADDLVAGKALNSRTRAHLARIGLDENTLRGIHEEVRQVGEDINGIRVSNSLAWRDAQLAERYESAIVRESRITVSQPGAADRMWFTDKEIGRVLFQLKSFALGAPTRLAMEPAQLLGNREALAAARVIGFMMVGGYLTYAFRMYASGFIPTTDPVEAAGEAFTESGLGGALPDLLSPIGRRLGLLGEGAKYADRNVWSAYGGPALGTAADAYDVAFNRTQGGMSARDLHALRRLMPFQNAWFARRAINALEGETAEALELQGATEQGFFQRLTESQELLPSEQRGGMGTGALAN